MELLIFIEFDCFTENKKDSKEKGKYVYFSEKN